MLVIAKKNELQFWLIVV